MKILYGFFIIFSIISTIGCSRQNVNQKDSIRVINTTQKDEELPKTIQIDIEKDTIEDTTTEYDIVAEDPKTNKRNLVQSIYMSQVGIREKTGHNDGKEVEMYLKSAGLSKGNPWCASFVTYVYKECDVNIPKTGLGWVPSYFPSNKTIYVRGKYSKMKPKYGDLIGIWFPEKKRLAHIGFYDNEDNKYYYSVEGNTNQAGSREGDGVYIKRRVKGQVHSISNWID